MKKSILVTILVPFFLFTVADGQKLACNLPSGYGADINGVQLGDSPETLMKALGVRLEPKRSIPLFGMMNRDGKFYSYREWIEETMPDADEATKEKTYEKIFLRNARSIDLGETHYRYSIYSPKAKKQHPNIEAIRFTFFEGSLWQYHIEFRKTRKDLVGLIANKLNLPTARWTRKDDWYARLDCPRFRVIVQQFTDRVLKESIVNVHDVYVQDMRLLKKRDKRLREKYIELEKSERGC